MKLIFQDTTFSLQFPRAVGQTYYGGADIGECLFTAYRIKEGNFESWYSEWLKTAQLVHKYADESLSSGHKVSAKDGYLRAFKYYRTTEFLLIIVDGMFYFILNRFYLFRCNRTLFGFYRIDILRFWIQSVCQRGINLNDG